MTPEPTTTHTAIAERIIGHQVQVAGIPVVSPDGKWLAFQASDYSSGEIGEGVGIYRIRIAP